MTTSENLGIDLLVTEDFDLAISPSGDLALTVSGRETFLQDILHVLITIAGDLYSHPSYGSGIPALIGESDSDIKRKFARIVEDTLSFSEALTGRIVYGSVVVELTQLSNISLEAKIQLQAIEDGVINLLNLVWEYGLEDMTTLVKLIEEGV